MAAEALLVNGATEILKKLSSTVAQEIGGAWGVKKELEKLKSTLETIQAILQDAEKQQSEKEAVRLWLRRLKDLALDADNLLDEFAYEDLRGRVEIQNHLNKRVRRFFSRSNRIAFRFEMAHKIRHINELLAEIKGDASGFQLQVGSVDASPSTQTQISRETHSFVDDSEIVGRSKDKSAIIEMLIDSNNQEALSVIPIVGLGGMGKTTLAQSIYNDESVVRYFDTRIWVYVSEIFDVKTILSKILDSVTRSKNDIKTTDLIVQSLQQKLSGRSLLLVLDDVWNEDNKQWEELKAPLRFGVSGGKIIVTTRSNKAASIMTTVSPYHLEPLSKEDTWSLFKKRAFRTGGPEETPDLVEIGMEIVNKCGGVPLAAMSVGSLMYFKKEIHEWSCVLSSETWKLPEDRSGIFLH